MNLKDINIGVLNKLGEKREKALNSIGIFTFHDLIYYYPRKYVDRMKITKIFEISGLFSKSFTEDSNIENNDVSREVTLIVKLVKKELRASRGRGKFKQQILNATFSDESGTIYCNWFKFAKFYSKELSIGSEYILSGRPNLYNNYWQISHPILEKLDNKNEESINPNEKISTLDKFTNTGQIISMYPLSQGLTNAGIDSKLIRYYIFTVLKQFIDEVYDIIPEGIISKNNFLSLKDALLNIHFPATITLKNQAIKRLKFEELFYLQLILSKRKFETKSIDKKNKITGAGTLVKELYDRLPFELTDSQKKVSREIFDDLNSNKVMNRLLQGDVGSGKTIVALIAITVMVGNGYQTAIMAPTEILAEQHYLNFKKMCEDLDVNISLLTGKMRKKLKDEVLINIATGVTNIVIGTHAIIQKSVEYNNLGLIVIDEQHRFGVIQRGDLIKKAMNPPNILVMTATPIPRTLTLSLYGDLDISTIDSMPKGRKKIITAIRYGYELDKVYKFMGDEIKAGRQIYIVYPLIEKSEKLDVKSAYEGLDKIRDSHYLKDYNSEILHGKMKSEEKEEIMSSFKNNEIKILVSTTVIEVGVDVPNASIMLVMNSERFGLSQIHQLRGRVGRGQYQSYCILNVADNAKEESLFRMKILEKTIDGFEISEEDFKLRGPGEFFGEKQSGVTDLKLVNLLWDYDLLKLAREEAKKLISQDNLLSNYPDLRDYMNLEFSDKIKFLKM